MTRDFPGQIPAEWLAAARVNETLDRTVEDAIRTVHNVESAEIGDDGSIWIGVPIGTYLSQEHVDLTLRTIDAGI